MVIHLVQSAQVQKNREMLIFTESICCMEKFSHKILVYESNAFVMKRETWSISDFSRLSERFSMNENIIL